MVAEVYLDPNDFYKRQGTSPGDLINKAGLLAAWAAEYLGGGTDSPNLRAHMEQRYGRGPLAQIPSIQIKDNVWIGTHGDPDLHPMMKVLASDKPDHVLIYEFGLVAFISADGSVFAARMD